MVSGSAGGKRRPMMGNRLQRAGSGKVGGAAQIELMPTVWPRKRHRSDLWISRLLVRVPKSCKVRHLPLSRISGAYGASIGYVAGMESSNHKGVIPIRDLQAWNE